MVIIDSVIKKTHWKSNPIARTVREYAINWAIAGNGKFASLYEAYDITEQKVY
jgi:hypothetical protein